MEQKRGILQKSRDLFPIVLALIPIIYIFSVIFRLHKVPNNDYWNDFMVMFNHEGVNFNLENLFHKSNEHIIALPKLLFLLNYYITNGNNLGLFLIAFIIMCIQLYFLYKLFGLSVAIKGEKNIYILPVLALFVFTPAAAHNWIISMSGVVWFLANTFVIISIYYYFQTKEKNNIIPVIISLCFALFGIISYSTAIFLFPVYFVLLLLSRKNMRIKFWYFLIGAISITVWLIYFRTPSYHPDIEVSIASNIKFLLAFLGGIYSNELSLSLLYGLIGLVFFLILNLFLLLKNKNLWLKISPWSAISGYGLLNGIGSAMARGGFGVEMALSSRYATLPSLFWLGLILSAVIVIHSINISPKIKKIHLFYQSIIMLILLLIPMNLLGIQSIEHNYKYHSVDQEFASLSLQLGIIDEDYVIKIYPWGIDKITSKIDILRNTKHVPFDKEMIPNFDYGLDIKREFEIASSIEATTKGNFDIATPLSNTTYRLNGWAFVEEPEEIEYILFTNEQGITIGGAILGIERPDVAQFLNKSNARYAGWQGYARVSEKDKYIKAYVKLKHKNVLVLLNNTQFVD